MAVAVLSWNKIAARPYPSPGWLFMDVRRNRHHDSRTFVELAYYCERDTGSGQQNNWLASGSHDEGANLASGSAEL